MDKEYLVSVSIETPHTVVVSATSEIEALAKAKEKVAEGDSIPLTIENKVSMAEVIDWRFKVA